MLFIILSIEKNGTVLIEANSIALSEKASMISIGIPEKGQTISQDKFDEIVNKKTLEYQINSNAKTKKKGKK